MKQGGGGSRCDKCIVRGGGERFDMIVEMPVCALSSSAALRADS